MGDFQGHPFRGNQYTAGQRAEAGDVVAHKGERGVMLSRSGDQTWIHVEGKGARQAAEAELELISRGAVGYLRDDDPNAGKATILKRYAEQKDFLPEGEAKALDGRFGLLSMRAAEHRQVVKQVTGKTERELIDGLTRSAVSKAWFPGTLGTHYAGKALTARGKPAGDSENTRRRELNEALGVKPKRVSTKGEGDWSGWGPDGSTTRSRERAFRPAKRKLSGRY